MIQRYLLKEMENIFSDESRFNAYLQVEIAVLEAWSKIGVIPNQDVQKVKEHAKVDVKRINEIELITRHDVVAFTRQISETLGEEKRWVHYGLTSTDVVDTSLSLLYKKANELILKSLNNLLSAIKDKALTYKYTPCIGRTHGMHGEVISFGVKWANYYDELQRGIIDFEKARKEIEVAKISGAMGNYANIDPRIQDLVAQSLNIESANISTQVLSRDRHEKYACALTIISTLFEKIATEIRNLSRSEIVEVEEGFSKGQKGSSAMPQKRNPISSENITGGVRMIRGYLIPILEDNALYSERDISHSSAERIIFPDSLILIDFMLNRFIGLIENLKVNEKNMKKNANSFGGIVFSQKVMLTLVEKGITREDAYRLVQRNALDAFDNDGNFRENLLEDSDVLKYLTEDEINKCFDYKEYLNHVDDIFKRFE